jgi:hypothetical protein
VSNVDWVGLAVLAVLVGPFALAGVALSVKTLVAMFKRSKS